MSHYLSPSKHLPSELLRWMVGDLNFTIISNNCWGSHIYQALDIGCRTPFAGLFIPPKSYLRLLRHFDAFITADLKFADQSALASTNLWREREGLRYPIGLLEKDVELHFVRFADKQDARTQWQQGCQRIVSDPSRRFFKFDDSGGATADDVEEFCALPLRNKVCFTKARYRSSTVIVPIVAEGGGSQAVDGTLLVDVSRDYFNALRWISSWPKAVSLPAAF
jgi:uncharacterized protein (DUF1919 family)